MLITISGNFVYRYKRIITKKVIIYEDGLSLLYDEDRYESYPSWKVHSEIILESD